MKRIGRICKAASLLAMVATAVLGCKTEQENAIGLIIGTYGNHLYHYDFDPDDGSFTFKGKAEAQNPSYVLGYGTQDGGMEVFAVSEAGAESGVYSFSYIQSNGSGSETEDVSRNPDRCQCAKHPDMIMMTADLRQTGASPCFLLVLDDLPFTCDKDTAVNQREKTSAPSQGKEQGEKGMDLFKRQDHQSGIPHLWLGVELKGYELLC